MAGWKALGVGGQVLVAGLAATVAVVGALAVHDILGDDSGSGEPDVTAQAPSPADAPGADAAPPSDDAAPEPQRGEASAPTPPRFDLVRVDPQGSAVVAGSGAPEAQIHVLVDGDEAGQSVADRGGSFVSMFTLPASSQPRMITLEMELEDGRRLASEESVLLGPTVGQEPPDTGLALSEAQDAPGLSGTDGADETGPEIARGPALTEPLPPMPESGVSELPARADANGRGGAAPASPLADAAAPGAEGGMPGTDAPEEPEVTVAGSAESPPAEDGAAPTDPAPRDFAAAPEDATAPPATAGRLDADGAAPSEMGAPVASAPADPVAAVPAIAAPEVPARAGGADSAVDLPQMSGLDAQPLEAESLDDGSLDMGVADRLPLAGAEPPPETDAAGTAPEVAARAQDGAPGADLPQVSGVDARQVDAAAPDSGELGEAVADPAQPPEAAPPAPAADTAAAASDDREAGPSIGQDGMRGPGSEPVGADVATMSPDEAVPADAGEPAPDVTDTAAAPAVDFAGPDIGAVAAEGGGEPSAIPGDAPSESAAEGVGGRRPTVLLTTEQGVRVMQSPDSSSPPEVMHNVVIDAISYSTEGAVQLTGRGSGTADGSVRLYLDNQALATVDIAPDGNWRTELPQVDTGVYTLRADELDAEGGVVSRFETPFRREDPALLSELGPRADGPPRVDVLTVQPGFTLWGISRNTYGRGILYVQVFEANRDRIADPDLIYPGQVFNLPEISEEAIRALP